MAELKPCPFCGSTSVGIGLQLPQFSEELRTFVVCDTCGCRTAAYRKASVATDIWNARAEDGK